MDSDSSARLDGPIKIKDLLVRAIRHSTRCWYPLPLLMACLWGISPGILTAQTDTVQLEFENYDPACGVEFQQHGSRIDVQWPLNAERRARMSFTMADDQPLVHSLGVSRAAGLPIEVIAQGLDPVMRLRVGARNLELRGGWTIFFDRMQTKPHISYGLELNRTRAVATSDQQRATLSIEAAQAGPFQGRLSWTFYRDHPFVLQEASMVTGRPDAAYLFDAGVLFHHALPSRITWRDIDGRIQQAPPDSIMQVRPIPVRGRTIAAEFVGGALALYPLPHRFFYPLDFSDNLSNIWIGPNFLDDTSPFGMGIRHDPEGDNRFVPWFNSPPGRSQQISLFWHLSSDSAPQLLEEIGGLTRHDRFAKLDGFKTFASHFHVEHTQELLAAQEDFVAAPSQTGVPGRTPGGSTYWIPDRLRRPGFVQTLKRMGVDIVHLAEFHFGHTPQLNKTLRLQHLDLLHAECHRLSDGDFLLLPGEEPNVHLGGHWISLFPKPVYWVLNHPPETPFVSEDSQYGQVYHVGNEAEVYRLLQHEGGLAWTAHPRIKGSTGYPDQYRDQLFFQSERFLGAAWKAMPADLSEPRLGSRVLNLLDDMSNWGERKYVLGEVDVFKVEPHHELYGHMNVNYLRLSRIPRFEEGWQPVLDALSHGQFFVTTGEVLIPEFRVNGTPTGDMAQLARGRLAQVTGRLQWTFPLAFAELVSGDGAHTKRSRISLTHTKAFGSTTIDWDIDLTDQQWVRLEVWDIATNGAFTQPVWLNSPR